MTSIPPVLPLPPAEEQRDYEPEAEGSTEKNVTFLGLDVT
jgi:hypothetical protein